MRGLIIVAATALLASGCNTKETTAKTTATTSDGKKVVSALAIDTDDFKANIEVPGLEFSGKHMDINGIKLYPGSAIRGMHVAATDKGNDKRQSVTFDFVSPASPLEVVEYLTKQAEDAGYAVVRAPDTDGAKVIEGTRTKDDETSRLRFMLKPSGAQTAGSAALEGSDG